jgi:phospholipid-translocating ATPase
MLDGVYQAVICFFITYGVFEPAAFVTSSGLGINDTTRIGLYVACSAVIVVNIYMLLNTYRWDWLTLLVVAFSILLIYFWSGVYSSFTSAVFFYKAAPQVFAQASFWATVFLTVIICLLPRFTIKAIQKAFFPYDIDIVREQVRQGMFNHLDTNEPIFSTIQPSTITPSDDKNLKGSHASILVGDDQRSPPMAHTAATQSSQSRNRNDGTEYTINQRSLEEPAISADQSRPSFDRMRSSMDRIRPSFEASSDFTSAALLARVESSQSFGPSSSRRENVPSSLR